MIFKILAIMTVVASIANTSEGSPHGHHNDPYKPVIELLKEVRKARKYSGGGLTGIRDGQDRLFGSASNGQNSQFQFPSGGSSGNSGSGSGGSTPILNPGSSGSGGSFQIPPAAGGSSNFPPILPNFPSGSQIAGQIGALPPYPIEQVNNGVSTILNGVKSLDLGQILRGAFIFPRNDNVRSVANTVIDSIFGAARPSGGN